MPDMDYTDRLCTRCALCCDGSIFDDVELAGEAEATAAEAMGLTVEIEERPLLLQPCTALDGRRCTVYAHRPGCCRTFECRLLQQANAGQLDADAALEIIRRTLACATRIKDLCAGAGVVDHDLSLKERCIEVLAEPVDGDDQGAERLRGDLAAAMDQLSGLVGEHFL